MLYRAKFVVFFSAIRKKHRNTVRAERMYNFGTLKLVVHTVTARL